MTTAPIASPELPDLDKLEEKARAATPGRWMRLFGERTVYDRMEDGCRGNAIVRADLGYGPQDISNLDFIAGANPAAVLALIALARRAQPYATGGDVPGGLHLAGEGLRPLGMQPEGEVCCVICGSAEPRTGTCGSDDPSPLCKTAAATLLPLCGAQHAESGKESAGPTRVQDIGLYSSPNPYSGGLPAENWQRGYDGRRFIGNATSPAEKFYKEGVAALAAQQAAAAGLAKPELMRQAVASVVSRAGDDLRIAWLRPERCDVGTLLYCAVEQAAPSASGTPEAPKPAFPISDDEIAALRRFWECATDGEGYDVDKSMMQRLAEMGLVQRKSGAYYMATEFGLYVLGEYTESAAQLDGGQEGSAT